MATAALTEAATSKFVDAPGYRIHYNEAGPSAGLRTGSGDPIIFLHGSGPGATSYSNFVQNFAHFAEDYRVLLVDQPGYGESDPVDGPGGVVNAQAVKDFMDALGIEKAHVVGNSMGGMTAMTFTIDNPDRVDKLILLGAPASLRSMMFATWPSEGIKARDESFVNPSTESIRRFIEIMVYDSSFLTEELLQQRYEAMMRTKDNMQTIEQAAARGGVARDIGAEIGKITSPTLILHGRDDRVVPMEASVWTVGQMQDARLVVFNKCGHWVQYEKASDFNWLVRAFLTA